ncbi:ABC transporter permease [Thermotoga profunda]|uniref:ABC transporter permease n=1 Tax=Thermotoga profunda TaxID=1508420 RepID=UPI000597629C|nr:ABC transporter permease [Thermotoga profunda]
MSLGYLIRRIITSIPTVLFVAFVVFIMIHLVPGDVVDMILGTQNYLTKEQINQLYKQYGLDKPLIVQFGIWLKNLATLDFGTSLRTGKKVIDLIFDRFPVTLELSVLSMFFATIIGIPLGIIAAIKKNSFVDGLVRVIGLIGLSSPSFWVGAILIVIFAGLFQGFNIFGYVHMKEDILKNLQVMFLPSLTLGLMLSAQIMRMTRSSMLDVLQQEYMKTAKAKGVSYSKLIGKHALKNALIPIITLSGIQLGYLLAGTIVIENMFALPGLGRLLLQAVNERDYPVIQFVVMFIALVIVVLNIIVDFIYTLVDPRVELR